MVNKDKLRESLKSSVKRNPDAINIISSVAAVPEKDVQKFVDGDDEALTYTQLIMVDGLK